MSGPRARPRPRAHGPAADPDARAEAARVVCQVARRGRSLAAVLPQRLKRVRDPQRRALIQELACGTLRGYPRLEARAARLLERPPRARDADVHALLLVGLYQLAELDLPVHAAVDATVRATRALGKEWASGLVNATLRNWLRTAGAGPEGAKATEEETDAARWAHPAWLLERLRRDWPQDWAAVAAAGNARPPLHLRVNLARRSRGDYLARLEAAGLGARALAHTAAGVVVEPPVPVARLPGFAAGEVSVQDAAAQLAGPLLRLAPGQRVLDACAAPGGKTTHIGELEPRLDALVAVDRDGARLARLRENLARLGVDACVVDADAGSPGRWWDGRPFDRILLDAPCSGTGVVRRHPDIKLLRRPTDIAAFAREQDRLLDALWPLLAPQGMLLYATCSVLAEENERRMEAFLTRHPEARARAIEAPWGRACGIGRQILTGDDGMDGFYYARVERC